MGGPLLALSWVVTIKDFFGLEKVQLDKDSVKDKIKQVSDLPLFLFNRIPFSRGCNGSMESMTMQSLYCMMH